MSAFGLDASFVSATFSQALTFTTSLVSHWPGWASYPFLGLMLILSVLFMTQGSGDTTITKSTTKSESALRAKFDAFKRSYFVLYIVLMLSDWVQGTNMYTLYMEYEVDIGALFITGFGTSAIFSLFIGPYIDNWGRKKACILYCIGEVIINLLEHSSDFTVLLIGRVIGGLTTALLFTAFESWMVSSHRERGFKEEWLAETFSLCSVGNGVVAIFAGLVSQVMADWMGNIGPFRLAIFLSAVVGIYITLAWEENYGELTDETTAKKGGKQESFVSNFTSAVKTIVHGPEIALSGLIQATFQGAMFTFVFMWVPVIISVAPEGKEVPTGLVYASLMASIAIGGSILTHVQQMGFSPEVISIAIFAIAAVSMFVPVLISSLYPTLFAFFVFEMCVGAYDGVAGIIRSKYIPDGQMGSIMNIMRIPLNILVVIGTKMEGSYPHSTCFIYCGVWHVITLVMAILLQRFSVTAKKVEQRGKKKEA